LDSRKACAYVLERYIGVWIEVSWRKWSDFVGIFKLGMGRE
jgi:hypothetical protein